jgi:high-affinity nickel-transport protein
VTGYIGTGVSGIFLYIIAALNIVILIGIVKVFRELKTGTLDEETLEEQLQKRGFMNRFFGKLTKTITKPQQMYPIGVLFGLGFDTATEVALLLVPARPGRRGCRGTRSCVCRSCFAAGMSLLDTIDGSFMNFAYGWAFSKPVRKVFYNMTITGLSVAVALVIGTIELAGLIASDTHLRGSFWTWFENIDINLLGFIIVGMFVATWAIALAVWKYGHIEERWDAHLQPADPATVTSTDVRA